MNYQAQLQSEQRKALTQAMRLNEKMQKQAMKEYEAAEKANATIRGLQGASKYGIPPVVIQFLSCMAQYGIKPTRNNIIQFYNYNSNTFANTLGALNDDKIKLIIYTSKLADGRAEVGTEQELKKLLKTLSMNRYKITVNDLKVQNYKVYITNFKGESVENILGAFEIFKVNDPNKTIRKIAMKQKESVKPVSYLLGTYAEWEMAKLSEKFNGFRKSTGSGLDLIIQVDNNEIIEVPKFAIIKNIEKEPFDIYNSKPTRVGEKPKFYEVESISSTTGKILVKTDIKPVIKYKGALEAKGIKLAVPTKAEFDLKKYKKGEVKVYLDRGFYRLCNRFIIVGTLRPPLETVNLGCYKMLASDGTAVYVYARLIPYNKSISSGGIRDQRIYYMGFDARDIDSKLKESTQKIQQKLGGYIVDKIEPTVSFSLFEKKETLDYDE